MKKCEICGKTTIFGNNVPNSLHKTRRKIRPNLQVVGKQRVCTTCSRTASKN